MTVPLLVLLISISSLFFSKKSLGATATGNMAVSATVTASCTVSASTLAFGPVNALASAASPVDATSTVSVTCTNGTGWDVSLGVGAGTGATLAVRVLTGTPASTLTYAIYRDSPRTEIWGNGTGGNFTVADTGTGAVQSKIAYGRIPLPQPSALAATYADTVVATVTY